MNNEEQQEDWDVYNSRINDHPAVVMVNLAQHQALASHPRHFVCIVDARQPDENGFPSREERETILYPLEDALGAALKAVEPNVLYVGKMTYDGRVHHCFYCPPPSQGILGKFFGKNTSSDKLVDAADKVMKDFPGYSHIAFANDDPEWDLFFSCIFPTAWQRQKIWNQRVLRSARSQGDLSDKPRALDHFIVCPTAEIQHAIATEALALGFKTNLSTWEAEGERPEEYCIEMSKEGIPDTIDEIVWPLFEIAQKHGARYDGWGCAVITSS